MKRENCDGHGRPDPLGIRRQCGLDVESGIWDGMGGREEVSELETEIEH